MSLTLEPASTPSVPPSLLHDRRAIDVEPRILDERWPPSILARATWAFVALGVLIRVVRLVLVHPLWDDECFVVANLLDRGYLRLLRPLDYQQVCPPLFLWLELSAIKLFELSEWSVRLIPTVAAIASLFLLRHVASRLVGGLSMLLCVAILAVSVNPIRHGGEAKPYATDFLVSLALVALAVEWWRSPEQTRWLWVLSAFAPMAIGLSLPGSFVVGGILLSLGWPVFRGRRSRVIAAYLAASFSALGAFGLVMLIRQEVPSDEVRQYMLDYWSDQFPTPRLSPDLLVWLIQAHTGDLFAYPVGGSRGASVLTTACVVIGSVELWRRGRGMIVALGLAPLGLALVASGFRRYPYGETERLMQFAGPMICLMAGLGLAWLIGRVRRPRSYRRVTIGVLGLFFGVGLGIIAADLIRPSKTVYDLKARAFARAFWTEVEEGAELACERSDLGLDLELEKEQEPVHHGRSANYLCYQKMDSTRHRLRLPLDWRRVSPDHPLRCVFYDGVPAGSSRFEAWMNAMNRHYRLISAKTYRGNPGIAPKGVTFEDHIAVLEFAPIGDPVDPGELARLARSSAANR